MALIIIEVFLTILKNSYSINIPIYILINQIKLIQIYTNITHKQRSKIDVVLKEQTASNE